MEALQRLQAIDFVLVIIWALFIGWGVSAGVIRMVLALFATYVGLVVAAGGYQALGTGIAMIVSLERQAEMQIYAYGILVVLVPALLLAVSWGFYRNTRLAEANRADSIGGGVVAAIAGIFLLIGLITTLRLYTVTQLPRDMEVTKFTVAGELQRSQLYPMVRVGLTPFWVAASPWFPEILKGVET